MVTAPSLYFAQRSSAGGIRRLCLVVVVNYSACCAILGDMLQAAGWR
jgi:hypothetical protein